MLTLTRERQQLHAGQAGLDSALQPLRLLVVDDHPAVRAGLASLLGDQEDFEVVAEASTAESAVAQAENKGVDVAIVDYDLGGRNGLWVSRKLKDLARPPAVIIFSAYASDHLAASCIVARADALLSKGSLGSELCDAIRMVVSGSRTSPMVPEPMANMLRRRLDEVEQPIFGMLLAGMPRAGIEHTLGMSERELDSRERAMLRKLEALPGEGAAPRRDRRRFGLLRP
jgi:DNA-binding NarL/FixJ family response regulator